MHVFHLNSGASIKRAISWFLLYQNPLSNQSLLHRAFPSPTAHLNSHVSAISIHVRLTRKQLPVSCFIEIPPDTRNMTMIFTPNASHLPPISITTCLPIKLRCFYQERTFLVTSISGTLQPSVSPPNSTPLQKKKKVKTKQRLIMNINAIFRPKIFFKKFSGI